MIERLAQVMSRWTIHASGNADYGPLIDHIASSHRAPVLLLGHATPAISTSVTTLLQRVNFKSFHMKVDKNPSRRSFVCAGTRPASKSDVRSAARLSN